MSRKKTILAVLVTAATVSSSALAADATTSVYGGSGTNTQKTVGTLTPPKQDVQQTAGANNSAVNKQSTAATLPFTGMDLGFVVLGGAALVGLGYSLRRLTRDTDS